jgi:hypothetical protein
MATALDPDEGPLDDDLQSSRLDPDSDRDPELDDDDSESDDDDPFAMRFDDLFLQDMHTPAERAQDLEQQRRAGALASADTEAATIPASSAGGATRGGESSLRTARTSPGAAARARSAGAAGSAIQKTERIARPPPPQRDTSITLEERGKRMFGRRGVVYRVNRIDELREAARAYFHYIVAGRKGHAEAVDICRQCVTQLMEFYVVPRCAETHPENNMVFLMRAAMLEIATVEAPMRGDRCMITRKPLIGENNTIQGGRLDAYKPTPGNRPRHKTFKLHGTIVSWFFTMRTLMNWDKFVVDSVAADATEYDVADTFTKCFSDVAVGIGASLCNDEIKTDIV